MKCKKIESLTQKYIDNELDTGAKANMDSHLHQCPSCKAKVDKYIQVKQLIKRSPQYSTNPYLSTRVIASLQQTSVSPLTNLAFNLLKAWTPVAFTLFLLLSFIWFYITPERHQDQLNEKVMQKTILQISPEPQNMEQITMNLLIYNSGKPEVAHALF